MAKGSVTKNWRINKHIMAMTIGALTVATLALLMVLCFLLFFSPSVDAEIGDLTYTAKKIGLEETPPGQGDLAQDPVDAAGPAENVPAAEPEPTEEPDPYTYTDMEGSLYAQTSLRVRNQPSIDGERIGGLYRNQEVKVTGQCNETGWYRIDYYGDVGYASNDYLAEEPVKLDITQSVGSFAAVDKSYYDNVLFIGDSLTVGLSMYGSLKNATYFCITGMGTGEALSRDMGGITLDALLDVKQYEAVYIMLGINDMGGKRKSYLASYSSLLSHVQEKQPDADIVIQSILPVTSSYTADHPSINNDEIRERNASLAELADSESIFYLDLNAFFADEAGNLSSSQARDGLHLTAKSYKVWREALLANGIVK